MGGLTGLGGAAAATGSTRFTGIGALIGSGSFWIWPEPLCSSSSGTTGITGIKGIALFGLAGVIGATGFRGIGNARGASIGLGLLWMSFVPFCTGLSGATGLIGVKGSTRLGGLAGAPGWAFADDSISASDIRGRIRIRLAGNIVRLTGAAG